MRRSTAFRRLRKLALALVACGFAVVAPLYFFAEPRIDDSFAISISAVRAAPSHRYRLTSPVRLSVTPDLTLRQADIDFYGPEWGSGAKDHVRLDRPVFTLNVAGRHAMAAGTTAVPAPPSAEGSPDSASGSAPDSIVRPLLRQVAALGFDLITIQRGTLHVAMGDGRVETLKDIQAEVKKLGDGRITTLGSFTVRGRLLAFEAALHEPPDKAQPSRWPLKVSIKSGTFGLLQGSFDGYADLGVDLQLVGRTELATANLRAIGSWFGLPLSQTEGFNATAVKGELVWAQGSLAFEKARITVDGNEGNGRVVLDLTSPRPTIGATLDFNTLNLTPYVEAAHVGSPALSRTRILGFELPAAWSSSFDVSLPMFGHLDADLRISAQEVTLKEIALGQGAATITAQAGKLHADIAELQLPSGTLNAQITATMSEAAPHYALRAQIEDLELSSATGLLPQSPTLSGKGAITLDLTGTGHSLADVVKSLSGKVALTMPKGARLAFNLTAPRATAGQAMRGGSKLTRSQTDLDRLEAQATIIRSVAFSDNVQARAGDMAMALTGRLGLVDGTMDLNLLLKAQHPPEQPLALTDMPDRVATLRGPWRSPRLQWRSPAPSANEAGP